MRFRSLDGWRGLAAILVALYHLEFLNHFYDLPFLRNSYLFVDFFFVLSGFVIAHAYQNKLNNNTQLLSFIEKRIARLWPLHIFILFLFLLFELLKLYLYQTGNWDNNTPPLTGTYSIYSLITNVFLLHSLGLHEQLTWNYPSWSISVEFYTYLVFALTTFLLQSQTKWLRNAVFIFIIAGCLYLLYKQVADLGDASYNWGIFRCIAGFFLGSLCYQLFKLHQAKKLFIPTILEISILIAIYFFVVHLGHNKYSLLAPLLFVTAVYIFSLEQGKISDLLKMSFLQDIGKWSYSIYMLHALIILFSGRVINFLSNVLGHDFNSKHTFKENSINLILIENQYVMDLLTILYLIVLIYLSSLTYKYIEKKGNNLLMSYFTKKSDNS